MLRNRTALFIPIALGANPSLAGHKMWKQEAVWIRKYVGKSFRLDGVCGPLVGVN